ncbi:unnamed protein product [Phaeothamnion confervicola]
MADRLEEKKDFSEDVKTKIPEAKQLAELGHLSQALEVLMSLERNCRVGNDITNLKEVVLAMIRLCKDAGEWEQLNATLALISKRRAQHPKATAAMVQEAMGWLDQTPDRATKMALVMALRDVTDGRIFMEGERAKLTRLLAAMKEEDGDIEGAADVMQEVAVEAYGALDKKEKADFILEQIRLTLARKDYVRALIQSRKINRKVIIEDDLQDIKVRFYELMVQYYVHEQDAWELCQCYHSIYDTPAVAADPARRQVALAAAAAFLVLSPHDNHQQDMLHRVARDPRLAELPVYKELLRLFTTPEIIGYPLAAQAEIEAQPALALGGTELLAKWKTDLHTRVVQHNVRVAARYYRRVRLARLAQLLGLSEDGAERHVADMVCGGGLYARIDRPAGVVAFARPKPAEEVLTEWNSDISTLLALVERTCHIINKENMLHKATA